MKEEPRRWQQEILGKPWVPSNQDRHLRYLARKYLEDTENFDQRHCVARNARGIAIPSTPQERLVCSQFAREAYRAGLAAAERLGFCPSDWRNAIRSEEDHYRRR